jgi:hypothetical protein
MAHIRCPATKPKFKPFGSVREMTLMPENPLETIERLERLAAWHRINAEHAGADWVWEARLRTAEDLERRVAKLRAQLSPGDSASKPGSSACKRVSVTHPTTIPKTCAAAQRSGLDRAFDRAAKECLPNGEYSLPHWPSIALRPIAATWPRRPVLTKEACHGHRTEGCCHHRSVARHWRGPRQGVSRSQLPGGRDRAFDRELEVAYCRLVTISTNNITETNGYRSGVGAHWPFLSDVRRIVQKDLGIAEYTDPIHNPMIPHVIVLEPGLVVHKVYNGYWYFGRPTLEDLRQDLRDVIKKCRPDWDITRSNSKRRSSKAARNSFIRMAKPMPKLSANKTRRSNATGCTPPSGRPGLVAGTAR